MQLGFKGVETLLQRGVVLRAALLLPLFLLDAALAFVEFLLFVTTLLDLFQARGQFAVELKKGRGGIVPQLLQHLTG
ncbi:hypothetical protein D3C76_1049430 [compost metagenome]